MIETGGQNVREKSNRLVISFHTTTAAIQMEKYCTERGLPGRLIPLPREISAGCGMAGCAPPESRRVLEEAGAALQTEFAGIFELFI